MVFECAIAQACLRSSNNAVAHELPSNLSDRVAALLPQWRTWLRLRHRSIAHLHADLAQQAAADLLEWMQRSRKTDLVEEDLRRLGFRILQRRVADTFRSQVAEWGRREGDADVPREELDVDARADANPEQAHHYARLLRSVMVLLAELGAGDRALLLGDELGPVAQPRTAAQRQRLKRLRAHLREQLEERFGLAIDLHSEGGD